MNLKVDLQSLCHLKNSKEERIKKNEQRLREIWDTIKNINICVMVVSEGEERKKVTEKIF